RRHTRFSRDWSSDVCSSDLQDAMASYNEFLETASQFDALCCPSPQRFAFHVLLGRPQPPQEAEVPGNRRGVQINFNIGAHTGLRSEERRVGKESSPRWVDER